VKLSSISPGPLLHYSIIPSRAQALPFGLEAYGMEAEQEVNRGRSTTYLIALLKFLIVFFDNPAVS
jgi:hypothetical protein